MINKGKNKTTDSVSKKVIPKNNLVKIKKSNEIIHLDPGQYVSVLGLVIRKQKPLGKVVFITLEDELGHIPLLFWPDVYDRNQAKLGAAIVVVSGRISKRAGTMNIIVSSVTSIESNLELPVKEWR